LLNFRLREEFMGEASGSGETGLSRRETLRAVVAATIGNGIEWFDFISFAFFTPFIAKTFFPSEDPNVSLILTWVGYGVGIVVRPIAGALLGIYGDRIGRQRVLSGIIIAMAVGIGIIAVTPGYATIGIAAPILLLVARILQGVSATGEYSSGIAFLVEYAPPGRKFLFGSFQFVSQSFATILATLAGYGVSAWLTAGEASSGGWRIPFLIGVIVGPIGFYIRRRVAEAPEFAQMRKQRPAEKAVPYLTFLGRNWAGLVTSIGITIPGTVVVYLWFLYGPAYAKGVLHIEAGAVNLITAITSLGVMALCPLAGYLSDRNGPWRWFLPAAVALGVTAYPMFSFLIEAPSAGRFLIVQAIAMVIMGFIQGSVAQLTASFFPTSMRSSGLGLSINLGVALFGGLAPAIVTWLIKDTGDKLIPAYYIIVAVVASMVLLAIGGFGKVANAAVLKQEKAI
jgi:MHS family proline/betaine transporter-like MFS transporter